MNIINIENKIKQMSLENKVLQLFIVTPESLVRSDKALTVVDSRIKEALELYPVGGFLYFGRNLVCPEQIKDFIETTREILEFKSGFPPFQCIDEEGGDVSRVAQKRSFSVENAGYPADIAKTDNFDSIYEKGRYIGKYLSNLGFNVDFAPCVDVLTNPVNRVIGKRAFGSEPSVVVKCAIPFANGLMAERIVPSFKHFPGHGDTSDDSHLGYAFSNKTMDEIEKCELIPYVEGIRNDIPMIMTGHISFPNIVQNDEPASLSHMFTTELLRNTLGFKGVIVTDSLKMKAITELYSPAEASIRALEAGADLLLRPIDFYMAFDGVLEAIKCGRLSEERINESVKRVLELKTKFFLS